MRREEEKNSEIFFSRVEWVGGGSQTKESEDARRRIRPSRKRHFVDLDRKSEWCIKRWMKGEGAGGGGGESCVLAY